MKRVLQFLVGLMLVVSCSAPKYTYNFDHYNYQAGKKNKIDKAEIIADKGPQVIQPESLIAATEIVIVEPATPVVENKLVITKKTNELTKSQRTELKNSIKALKKGIKAEQKRIKSSAATSALDHDLKLAAVFGAVGVVGIILGSLASVFSIIGGISLLIGVVFFVIWLTKQ